jgi:hypothetical protein
MIADPTINLRRDVVGGLLLAVCACSNATLISGEQDGGPFDGALPVDGGSAEGSSGDSGASDAINPACLIDAASYDHSCTTDKDCVSEVMYGAEVSSNGAHSVSIPVASGNYCISRCNCAGSEVIGMGGVAPFIADVSRTPLGSGQVPLSICSCPVPVPIPSGICEQGFCGGVRTGGLGDAGTSGD